MKNKSSESLSKDRPFFKKIDLVLLPIIGIAFIIRFAYFSFDIPITLDGSGYFWYAIDMNQLGHFPDGYRFPNNGWPAFLSVFFTAFHSTNFMDYMHLQKALTVTLSVITVVIVYLLCSRFFEKKIAVTCSMLFAFDPKIIVNSTLGITEPLFILLVTLAMFLFLSERKKLIYASFAVVGLLTLVRYEGFLLIVPFLVMFFVRFRKEKKIILQCLIALFLFAITIAPMSYVRTETTGSDGVLSHVYAGPQYYQHVSQNSEDPAEKIIANLLITGITNTAKYIGWSTVPVFLCFLPFGIYVILKERNWKNRTLIISLLVLLLPAFYAYSRNLQETRYLFVVYPIFCVLAGFTIKLLFEKFKRKQIITLVLFVAILSSSVIFLESKKADYEHEREAYDIAKEMTKRTRIINHSYQEEFAIHDTKYYRVANIETLERFPVLSNTVEPIQFIETSNFDSLEEYLKFGRQNGLEYLIIDDNSKQPGFLRDVFNNEEKYPFLHKEFDSHEHNYKYYAKIFKINYDKLVTNT